MIAKKEFRLNDINQSNLFLRFLWAKIRSEFGKLSWQYTPRKVGSKNQIRLGFAQIGNLRFTYEVSVLYKKAGVVSSIIFVPIERGSSATAGDIVPIQRMLDSIDERNVVPKLIGVATEVELEPSISIGHYFGDFWQIAPLSDGRGELKLKVFAFDSVDANYEFAKRCNAVTDILSCATNCAVRIIMEPGRGKVIEPNYEWNDYFIDPEWLDDFPVRDGVLKLSQELIRFGDRIVSGENEDDRIARSAHLFHRSLTLYREKPLFGDISTALFISALEAISLPDAPPGACPSCGQPIHKISSRVVELGIRHLGEGVGRILKESYQKRSKYLHVGQLNASQPLVSKAIPQLEPSGIEGCAMPMTVGAPLNLMEFASFIIRSEIRDKEKSFGLDSGTLGVTETASGVARPPAP